VRTPKQCATAVKLGLQSPRRACGPGAPSAHQSRRVSACVGWRVPVIVTSPRLRQLNALMWPPSSDVVRYTTKAASHVHSLGRHTHWSLTERYDGVEWRTSWVYDQLIRAGRDVVAGGDAWWLDRPRQDQSHHWWCASVHGRLDSRHSFWSCFVSLIYDSSSRVGLIVTVCDFSAGRGLWGSHWEGSVNSESSNCIAYIFYCPTRMIAQTIWQYICPSSVHQLVLCRNG